MNAIELFCGAGGTSAGFQAAGFDIRLGLDFDSNALETFSLNHPNAKPLQANVEDVTGRALLKAAKLKKLDVLIGGPSCQGYSTIGKRIADDPRNFLFTHYIRLVSELQPRWILFENVRGMLLHGGRFLQELVEALRVDGYRLVYGVLNAADFGVPQRRERLFIVGTREKIELSLPKPTHHDPRCRLCARPNRSNRKRMKTNVLTADLFAESRCPNCLGTGIERGNDQRSIPWVSVWDAIGDLPTLGNEGGTDELTAYSKKPFTSYQRKMRLGSHGYTLHRAKPLSPFANSLVSKIPEGQGVRAIPENQLPERFRSMRKVSTGALRRDCTTLYYRLDRSLPSYTITCYSGNVSSGAFTHPTENRAITVREAARLQSFPDAFEFNAKDVRRQIGNAIPPLLAQKIGEHLLGLKKRNRLGC